MLLHSAIPQSNDAILINNDYIYIGTSNGLNMLDLNTEKFTHYFIEDGLPNQTIYHLLKDNDNNIWMSTNGGLSVLNTYNHQFLNFDADDGLQSNEFNQLSAHAANNGYLYFGGVNGYNYFKPNTIKYAFKQPKLYLTKLSINGKEIAAGDSSLVLKDDINKIKSLTLNYNQATFDLEFVAIDYLSADKISYSYALNDPSKWIELHNQRKISFNRLSPDQYTLYIKALSRDGETYSLKTIDIIIKPPFYATTSFIIVCSAILLLIIWWVFKIRTKNIENQKTTLQILVKERTKEIASQRDIALHQKEEISVSKRNYRREK